MAELTFERDSVSVRALKLKSKTLIKTGKYALNDYKASMTKRVDAQSIVEFDPRHSKSQVFFHQQRVESSSRTCLMRFGAFNN
jgi:hypothetical protein